MVCNEDGYLLAAPTNYRIEGIYTKQQWGGRKNSQALYVGEEKFDATDAVLLLDHAELISLVDGDESTDALGVAHVQHKGPCEVAITQSILDYFGVASLREITPEALAYAREKAQPQPACDEELTLTIKVKVKVALGKSVTEFIEELDYSVVSKTPGIIVIDTEIVDSE